MNADPCSGSILKIYESHFSETLVSTYQTVKPRVLEGIIYGKLLKPRLC
jgi:hypothetical protein